MLNAYILRVLPHSKDKKRYVSHRERTTIHIYYTITFTFPLGRSVSFPGTHCSSPPRSNTGPIRSFSFSRHLSFGRGRPCAALAMQAALVSQQTPDDGRLEIELVGKAKQNESCSAHLELKHGPFVYIAATMSY